MLSRFLRSRLFRNLLFWAIVLHETLDNTAPHHKLPGHYYYPFIAITFAILVVMTNANNFWLVPRFLARRRYWIYFPSAIALTFLAGLLYTLTIKTALTRFPVTEIQQVTMIHSPVSHDWSVVGVLADTESQWSGFMIWTALFTLAWYANDYARQARAAREARARQTGLELSALKSQLHPHFLFNTLNNLYGLASSGSAQTPGAILQLSALLRYLLYDSAADAVSFGAEEEAIHAYANLERLRLDESAGVDVQTAGPSDARLPPLLWLPVLENAFKHGTHFIGAPYAIHFRMEVVKDELRIECRNRFKPGSAAAGESASGIGLANLRKRIELLFPQRHSLQTTTEGNCFHLLFTATLPAA